GAGEATADQLEDLGWNDMGAPELPGSGHEARVLTLTPERANPKAEAATRLADTAAHSELAAASRSRRKALEAGRRAAFTLRLDARRHLMLRLASTVKNRSAQQLVTAALDQYLADL